MEHLSPYEKVKLARDPRRPYFLDYVEYLCTDFVEIHGDRKFGDDPAIVTGFALFQGRPVCLVGHQKGRDTRQKVYRNFGMPKPEGYRKALRVMKLAEKFRRPIFTFIDTPGAYPGVDAEERGQAEAIAYNLREMAKLRVPLIVAVTGEGGSGGALAIGMGDRVLMLENSIYSVISPESCSAILWRDQAHAEEAARALKVRLQVFEVEDQPADLREIFHLAAKENVGAMIATNIPPLGGRQKQLADLAIQNRLPLMTENLAIVDAGGLVFYGPKTEELFRRAAVYIDKILKGAKPADLPVEQPKKFEFVINLKTAKQIGLTIPPNVLARADRVIK